jgi:hypothetical protein
VDRCIRFRRNCVPYFGNLEDGSSVFVIISGLPDDGDGVSPRNVVQARDDFIKKMTCPCPEDSVILQANK